MKPVCLLLTFSMIVSANYANAQDEPAKESVEVVVEGKAAEIQKLEAQLDKLRAQLEATTAEAKSRAAALNLKEQALAEHQKMAAEAMQQVKKQQKLAQESLLQADMARAEAEKAKLSEELDIGRYKALLQQAEKKQGVKHAYSQTLRNQYQQQLMALEMELAKVSERFGSAHPMVKSVQQRVAHVRAAIEKIEKPTSDAKDSKNSARGAVSRAKLNEMVGVATKMLEQRRSIAGPLSSNVTREQLAEVLGAVAEEWQKKVQIAATDVQKQAELATRYELAAREQAQLLQEKRIKELMEMQKRVISAENVAVNVAESVAKGLVDAKVVRGVNAEAITTYKRFDKLEEKLDRIALLLEKLVESKE